MSDASATDIGLVVPPATTMAAIAAAVLGDRAHGRRIGGITLLPHQVSAVERVGETLQRSHGALLCDETGLGKTYVAIAVAASYGSVAVVAPAALRDMWRTALQLTSMSATFVSTEALGRGGAPEQKCAFVVVDEAHHFRNPSTRRYAALAQMCALAPVLLLSATPLHNARDDIAALAALFAGSRAYRMSDAELAQMTVRRAVAGAAINGAVPVLEHAPPRVVINDEAILDAILSIPPPVPPRDGSIAARLVVHGLVRQWVSSNSALVAALKRRIARSRSLLESLDIGRYPTASELAAWVYMGDSVQLAFGELVVEPNVPPSSLASSLRTHVDALSVLLDKARGRDDSALIEYVRAIRQAHPGERIVAFTCYAETAESLYRALRNDGHVALLTARGALIASGPVSRTEVLAQFDPSSPTSLSTQNHLSISLLIATDLLSEGVNLQSASVVIHIDLPWTAARMEQRTGRLVRLGSPHTRVAAYPITPPQRAESCLHELEILATKAGIASQLLGEPPSPGAGAGDSSAVGTNEALRQVLESWRDTQHAENTQRDQLVSFVQASMRGAIGAWIVDGTPLLLTVNQHGDVSDSAARALLYATAATRSRNTDATADVSAAEHALTAAAEWSEHRSAWNAVVGSGGYRTVEHGHNLARSLARVADATVSGATFAQRFQSAAVAARIRSAAARAVPLAVEWSLESMSECTDDASVNSILDLVETARPTSDRVHQTGFRCAALIVFVADTESSE